MFSLLWMAGARSVSIVPREQRIQHLIQLKSTGQWDPEVNLKLAEEWGIAEQTVRFDSYQAAREMRVGLGDKVQIRMTIWAALMRVGWKAEIGEGCKFGPDYKAAYKSYSEAAKLMGAYPAQKIEHTIDHVPTAALVAETRELAEKIERQEGVLMLPERIADDSTDEQHSTSETRTASGTDDE